MDIDIKATKKRFIAINRERLRRVQNSLRWKQQHFLDLLPIFFHINHAMLPGYVSKHTPAGIPQYNPTKKALEGVKKISKSFVYRRRALRRCDVHSLFLMGSVGTIAQSSNSDFDIWVCHDPELTNNQLSELRAKCQAIEKWSETIDLEVHFFLMNAEKFKRGEVHELSSESSGSTQHHLLLEEFYRTSLLVAGRYPIWWLIPPEEEKNYDELAHELTYKRFIPKNEVIDFGGLSHIPAEEFFGAALWQVYKGIDSPYKSVLKILLMETYASVYPNSELLSLQYKSMVYDGVIDLSQLDPYIILYKKLEQYLIDRNELERLELVRQCFYFKVNLPLSHSESNRDDNWQTELLWDMVSNWDWSESHIESLDNRNSWKIDRVLGERKVLVDELTHSYLFLSNFARSNTSLSRINQKDLNILGRKLYAAFERKAGKIELINRGVSANVVERNLTIQQQLSDDNETWSLIIDSNGGPAHAPLKRGTCVSEILAWCHFNRIINPGTVISLETKNSILSIKEVMSILDALNHIYENGGIPLTNMENFSTPPKIISGCIFTNVGLDPLPAHTRRGTDIVSDRTDILNYSGFSFNLALSFDLIVVTSWQEILTYRYSGVDGLLYCVCQYLRWHLHSESPVDFEIPTFSYSSSHSIAIARRIEQLLSDVVKSFYYKNELRQLRYVLEVQKSYYIIYTDNDNFNFVRTDSKASLFAKLSEPQTGFNLIKADRFALDKTVVPRLLQKNKPGRIQLFYEKSGDQADIYVLDEHGALFHQLLPFHDDHALLNQYILFFYSVLNRRNLTLEGNDPDVDQIKSLEFSNVYKLPNGKIKFERKVINQDKLKKRYFHVQVIGNVADQKTEFTIYCNEREFNSFDYGKSLFGSVARYVYEKRASGIKYPIYITDLDLAPALLGDRVASHVQVIEFLNYKKRIEEKLNKELQQF